MYRSPVFVKKYVVLVMVPTKSSIIQIPETVAPFEGFLLLQYLAPGLGGLEWNFRHMTDTGVIGREMHLRRGGHGGN